MSADVSWQEGRTGWLIVTAGTAVKEMQGKRPKVGQNCWIYDSSTH